MVEPHRVGGRYEIGELLGRGGMAEVRKGTDIRLGRTVAVKRLRTDLASDATFQARFRREAQAAASLNHPAIVSVYDTGEELSTDGSNVSQPYIVMEYVAGRTLRDILREGRKILPERAMEIVSGTLGALDYSHRAGIIHRDIKPGNVMLTPAGDVKVMDFGIARAISDAHSTMTQTAAVVGTAQYLSPEQARGETVDSRSDVYSTGCLLFELLTGRPPFVGDSPVAVAYQHVREQAPAPSSFDADLPAEVDAIVAKALAKRLEDRYQSAAAMKEDVDRFLAGRPVQAPPVVREPANAFVPPAQPMHDTTATAVVPAATPDWQQQEEADKRRNRTLLILGALLVAVVVGAILLVPKMIGTAPEQTSVPRVTDVTLAKAQELLTRAGLTVGEVTEEPSETVEKGFVISQSPEGGVNSLVDPGTAIDLVVSSGIPEVEIPDVIGDLSKAATDELKALGLEPTYKPQADDSPKGTVLAVKPGVGELVPKGSKVQLTLSQGPQKLPDVVGKTQAEAEAILREAGWENITFLDDNASTEPKGTVTAMTPAAGTETRSDNSIVLQVSTFEEPEPTPTPTPEPTPDPTPLFP